MPKKSLFYIHTYRMSTAAVLGHCNTDNLKSLTATDAFENQRREPCLMIHLTVPVLQ